MRNRGFSLIEITVVLALLAISTALVTPYFSRFVKTVELKAAVKKVSTILRYYRSEAIHQRKVYRIFFDSKLREVRIQSMDSNDENEGEENKEEKNNEEKKKGEKKKEEMTGQKIYSLPDGVQMKEVKVEVPQYSSDVPTIEFYPNGGSNGGSVLIDRQDIKGYKIKVLFLTGMVEVERASS